MDLVERNLVVINNRVRLGLHGCVLKVPNGHTPTSFRGNTLGVTTFDPPNVNDYEFQIFVDKTESQRANIQFNESEGYLHLDDPDTIERNSHRGVNRKEAEENFSTIYPIVDEIKIGYIPTGVEKEYYLVTENCTHDSINFTVNDLYLFLDGNFNKVTILPRKQLRIYKSGGLLNFHSNNLYLWDNLLSKWINLEIKRNITDSLMLLETKTYQIDNQYMLDTIGLEITEEYTINGEIEIILTNDLNVTSLVILNSNPPNDLLLGHIFNFDIGEETNNCSIEVKQIGTNTFGNCKIKINYTGRP